MMNNVTLIGRVARDIELKKTQSGASVASIVIAVDRDFVSNGKREADFITLEVWNKVADYCANNIEKGRLISVQGTIRTNRYETKDGQKRVSFVVRVNRLSTLEKPRNKEGVQFNNGNSNMNNNMNYVNSNMNANQNMNVNQNMNRGMYQGYNNPNNNMNNQNYDAYMEINPDDIPF